MQDLKKEVASLKKSVRNHRIALYGIFFVLAIVSISVVILLKSVTSDNSLTSAVETKQQVKGASTIQEDLLQTIIKNVTESLKNSP